MKHLFGIATKCSDILFSLQATYFAFVFMVLWLFSSNAVVSIKSDVVDVLDFGAVGDDTADSSQVNSVPNPIFF